MSDGTSASRPFRDYAGIAVAACACAAVLAVLPGDRALPVLGQIPALPTTIVAALAGWPLLVLIRRGPLGKTPRADVGHRQILTLLGLGAALALPPIAIDLALPFARDINLPLPGALVFYPAVALVAEVVFHLLPLAMLSIVVPRRSAVIWLLAPVALVEPLFQILFISGAALQSWLVLGNVTLISAVQLWLFRRHGFAAMIGLRLAFYLAWHILWGNLRLALLF